MDRRTVIALRFRRLSSPPRAAVARGAAGGASTPSGGGDGAPTAARPRSPRRRSGPARSSCRARRRPPRTGRSRSTAATSVRFEQIAPEDPNLDFATQTAFVATARPHSPAGGRRHGAPVPRRRPHRPHGRSRRTAAYYIDVSFGDFPYAIRLTPAAAGLGCLRCMEDLIRIGAAASALGVSVDTLRRWERDGRVSFERRSNQRFVHAAELTRLLTERAGTSRTSARNRLTGTVISVKRDKVMAQVEIACGSQRIVSLMSRESADQLGLKPGVSATAVIKATTVIVERP